MSTKAQFSPDDIQLMIFYSPLTALPTPPWNHTTGITFYQVNFIKGK